MSVSSLPEYEPPARPHRDAPVDAQNDVAVVYLVEDDLPPKPTTHTRYWPQAYRSAEAARAAVERDLQRRGLAAVAWIQRGTVHFAHPASSLDRPELFRVVPLRVEPADPRPGE